jgi:hypothetical protein
MNHFSLRFKKVLLQPPLLQPLLLRLLLLLLLLPDTVSASSSDQCRFVNRVDYATSKADGFVVKGKTGAGSCCAACMAHAHPKPCLAAIWVPSKRECVLKLNVSQPKVGKPGVVACVPGSTPLPPVRPPAPLPTIYLALDSRNIVRMDSTVRLRLAPVTKSSHNPLLTEQHKWEMRFDNMGPTTLYDHELRRWRTWYSSFTSCRHPGMPSPPECCLAVASDCTTPHKTEPHGDRDFALLYAESTDGFKFEKPSLGLVDFNGSNENNFVGGLNHTTGTSVVLDTRKTTGPGRFKSFGCQKGEQGHYIWLGTSDDGVDFKIEKRHSTGGVPFGGASLDGHMNAIFNPETQHWIGFLRCASLDSATPTNWPLPVPGAAEQANRIQCYTESDGPDYLQANWTLPIPTGLNTSYGYQPDSHVAFRYGNIWLAFTNTFNPSQLGNVSQCDALAPGRSNMVLAWSVDGRKWESIEPNESFIHYFPGSGQWDCCSVFGAKQDVQQTPDYLAGHGTFPLYYTGCNGRFFGPRACGLGRVEVGRHQFAGLKNEGKQNAMVEIAPTFVRTGQLLLTVGGPGGARAGVVGDQALGVANSSVAKGGAEVLVTWAGGADLMPYKFGAVGLLVELEPGAVLYAIHM